MPRVRRGETAPPAPPVEPHLPLLQGMKEDFTVNDIESNYEGILATFRTYFNSYKANEKDIFMFMTYWVVPADLRDPRIEDALFELFELMLPETANFRNANYISQTPLVTLRFYKRLVELSPDEYMIRSLNQLVYKNSLVVIKDDMLLSYIITGTYFRAMSYRTFIDFMIHITRTYNNLQPRTVDAIINHPALPKFIRKDSYYKRYFFRNLNPVLRDKIIEKLSGRVYATYAETSIDLPTVPTMDLPPSIQALLSKDTVLSGGSLVRRIVGEYGTPVFSPELSEIMCSVLESFPPCPNAGDQDYDLYTVRSASEIHAYLSERGFVNLAMEASQKWNLRARIQDINSYTGWLMRYKGPAPDNISLDVILIRNHIDPRRPICSRPEDFIVREFDIDIAKVWYDGSKVYAASQSVLNHLKQRQMTIDFHPEMTINHHKTKTTIQRLNKYQQRGFELVVGENLDQFQNLMNRYNRHLVTVKPQSRENLKRILLTLETEIAANKDAILAYSDYFVRVRTDLARYGTPIPETSEVERPPQVVFLKKVIRSQVAHVDILDEFFQRVLGISVYKFVGGRYFFYGFHPGLDNIILKGEMKRKLLDLSPLYVIEPDFLQDGNFRWDVPEAPALPSCDALFSTQRNSPGFASELARFKEQCEKLEADPPCSAYFSKVHSVIEFIFDFLRGHGPQPTKNAVRGRELRSLWLDRNEFLVSVFEFFIRYEGEVGIDAGGLSKEFFLACIRQTRPLFSYINPEASDPRMYISNDPDQTIVDKLNFNLALEGDDKFVVSDLPELYMLVGKLFMYAILKKFNTEIPLSRLLLEAMVSKDISVKYSLVRTIFVMETGYSMEQIYYYDENPKTSEQYLTDESIDQYFLDRENPKAQYVGEFMHAFSDMANILSYLNVIPSEVYQAVCGKSITQESFEAYWRTNVTFRITDYGNAQERVITSGSEIEVLKTKFLSYLLDPQYVDRTIEYIRAMEKPASWYNPEMSAEDVLRNYYSTVIESITGFNTLDEKKPITVMFTKNSQITFFPHTCFSQLDISTTWLMDADFDLWLGVAVLGFFERKYKENAPVIRRPGTDSEDDEE